MNQMLDAKTKAPTIYKCDHCDYRNKSNDTLNHHIGTTHKEILCNYSDFKIISINTLNTHIKSAHKVIQQTPCAHSLVMPALHKSDFTFAHPPYEASFTKCLLRGVGCTALLQHISHR